MNYLKIILAFWQLRRSKRITSLQADLFFFLIQESSSRGEGSDWENPFECSNKLICAGITISEDAITDARNRLKQLGLIDFTPGERNRKSPVYEILYPFRTGNTADKVAGNNPGNTAGNNPNLIQRINETETERNKTSASSEAVRPQQKKEVPKSQKAEEAHPPGPPSPRKAFAPPTPEEVHAYFTERMAGNWTASHIDQQAQKWHDHYTANGWKVGKVPMRDWRAAVRNWTKNDYDNPNKKNGANNSGRLGTHSAGSGDRDYGKF